MFHDLSGLTGRRSVAILVGLAMGALLGSGLNSAEAVPSSKAKSLLKDDSEVSTTKNPGKLSGSRRTSGAPKKKRRIKKKKWTDNQPCDEGQDTQKCQDYWLKNCMDEIRRCHTFMKGAACLTPQALKDEGAKWCTLKYCSHLVQYWEPPMPAPPAPSSGDKAGALAE